MFSSVLETFIKVMDTLKLRPDPAQVEKSLDAIINSLETAEDRDACAKSLIDGEILPELLFQLQSGSSNKERVVQTVAELAKSEASREPCVTAGLVPPLLGFLSGSNIPAQVQVCRALGNICFDNDSGRNVIDENNGVEKLISLLRVQLQSSAEGSEKLRTVAVGFLLNLTNTHGTRLSSCNVQSPYSLAKSAPSPDTDSVRMITLRLNLDGNAHLEYVQEKALSLGAMEILDEYLRKHKTEEGPVQMALLSIGSLAEADSGREKLMECEISVTIAQLLGTEVGTDLQDTILELLGTIAEIDEVKDQLAKSDLTDRLLGLIDNCGDDEDGLQLQKWASDLIILLLTGDASMDLLYNNATGRVFQESLNWLQSSNSQLQMCGALAIGNFARNDAHCLTLVQRGITDKLLSVLGEDPSAISPTLQHAVFSALRNLAIPAANKPLMLECKLLDRILPHAASDMSAVHFKLLGTLRMVVDGQESSARALGTNSDFLDKLVSWCTVEEHAGVKGEATRFVACLIKHSHTADVYRTLVKHGALTHLINMVNSEHSVMQNEALVALSLMVASILDEISSDLAKLDLIAGLKLLLVEENTQPEIIANVLTLVTALTASDELKQHLVIGEFPSTVTKLKSHDEKIVKEQAEKTSEAFS